MFTIIHFGFGLALLLIIAGSGEVVIASRVMPLSLSMGFTGQAEKANVFNHNKTVVCMLDSWSHWRVPDSSFEIEYVDPSLCSQIVFRNAGIDNTTFRIKTRDPHLTEGLEWYRKIVGLSQDFPHLKVLLSVGGWNEGGWSFTKIAADYKKREVFVESVLRILKVYGFHGLDLAWEYPTWKSQGGTPEDKGNLPLLLKDLRDALGPKYLLTLTVSGDRFLAGEAYDIKAISEFVDQFNLRPFDFAGVWSDNAYHHAALKDVEVSRQSVVSSVNFYLERGAPPQKIVLGVPFYGRTFMLKQEPEYASLNASKNDVMKYSGLGRPTQKGVGFGGAWVPDDPTRLGYHELCRNITIEGENWLTFWDNSCHAPFARSGQRWVSFDNPESIEAKVELMLEKELKGMMAWTIDTDDFKGTACRKEGAEQGILKYPLLRTVNYAIAQGHMAVDDADIIDRSGERNDNDDSMKSKSEGAAGRSGADDDKMGKKKSNKKSSSSGNPVWDHELKLTAGAFVWLVRYFLY